MAAAGRRDVGEVPGAETLEQMADLGCLVLDLGDTVAGASRIKVKDQQPPGGRAWVVHRHRARLARRAAGGRAGQGRCGRHPWRSGRAECPRATA